MTDSLLLLFYILHIESYPPGFPIHLGSERLLKLNQANVTDIKTSCNNENTICYTHGLRHVNNTRLKCRILYMMNSIYTLITPHFKKVSVYAIKTSSITDT